MYSTKQQVTNEDFLMTIFSELMDLYSCVELIKDSSKILHCLVNPTLFIGTSKWQHYSYRYFLLSGIFSNL